MKDEIKKLLFDIKIAIEFIQSFTADTTTFEMYEKDFKTQSAVERQLISIAEAVNQIQKIDRNFKIESDYQIIAFRNRLVHAYDSIDNSIVWLIIKKYILELQQDIEQKIENLNA